MRDGRSLEKGEKRVVRRIQLYTWALHLFHSVYVGMGYDICKSLWIRASAKWPKCKYKWCKMICLYAYVLCVYIVQKCLFLNSLVIQNCPSSLQAAWLLRGPVRRQHVRGFWGLHRRGNGDVWAEESALWPLQYHQPGRGERIAAGLLHRRQYSDLLRSFVRLCHSTAYFTAYFNQLNAVLRTRMFHRRYHFHRLCHIMSLTGTCHSVSRVPVCVSSQIKSSQRMSRAPGYSRCKQHSETLTRTLSSVPRSPAVRTWRLWPLRSWWKVTPTQWPGSTRWANDCSGASGTKGSIPPIASCVSGVPGTDGHKRQP